MLRPVSSKRRRWTRPRYVVPVVAIGVVAGAIPATMSLSKVHLDLQGPGNNAVIGAAALKSAAFHVLADGNSVDKVKLALDGKPVDGTRDGKDLVVSLAGLADGKHLLDAELPGKLPMVKTNATRSFLIDTAPPVLDVKPDATATSLRDPVTITGTAKGASAVLVDGKKVALSGDAFTVKFPSPPAGVVIQAKDEAGNVAEKTLDVAVKYPLTRGVHMTALAWSYAPLRNPVLQAAREHRINTVELDIKDEDGVIGYNSQLPLAQRVGAASKIYDAKAAVKQLHDLGVRVIGRIVAFRDPKLGTWAWNNGHKDWVVQDPAGGPWASSYGKIGFTNFANPEVRKYNEAIALEAAKLGFDDIMYDYVRRPDGKINQMKFAGLQGTPEQSIADFVRDTRAKVRKAGSFLGAAVFGVSATRPKEVAQDIPAMSKYVDYVAPMVYPSHWAPGEYKVANPNAQPYDIVQRSLLDFLKQTKGTNATVMPWLQDFSLGVTYGAAEVQAQIKGAADDKIGSFLLWDAGCRYHLEVFPPLA